MNEAEEELGVNYFEGGLKVPPGCSDGKPSTPGSSQQSETSTPLSPVFGHSPYRQSKHNTCFGDIIFDIITLLSKMTNKLRTELIQHLFMHFLSLECGDDYKAFVPIDFLELCCKSFKVLRDNKKDNILYHLAKGLGLQREDGTVPRLPIHRMPFGMLSYNIRYFSSKTVNRIRADPDYIEWEATMCANCGHKWICLQRGPGFAYEEDVDKDEECGDNVQPVGYNSCNHNLLQQAWSDTCVGIDMDCPPTSCINLELTDDPTDSAFAITSMHVSNEPDSNSTDPVLAAYSEHAATYPIPDSGAESDPLCIDPVPESNCPVGHVLVQDTTYPTADHSDYTHPMPSSTECAPNRTETEPNPSNYSLDLNAETSFSSDYTPDSTYPVHDPCDPIYDPTNPTLSLTTDVNCSSTLNHSFLWAQLNDDEREDVCFGDDPVEIEKLHGVRPQGNKIRKKEVDPMKAKVNVAGHSLRTIQREILSHSYTRLLRFR